MTHAAILTSSPADRMRARACQVLLWANIGMISMIMIHDADHVRQASNWCYTISAQLWLVNVSVYIPSLIALVLLRYGRGAAVVTIVNGLLVGGAFSEVHLWRPSVPVWGIWNSNFFILGADWISWTVLSFTVLIGALVSAAGAYAMGLQWASLRTR